MEKIDYSYAVLTIFERIGSAVNGRSVSKAPLERRVAEIAKNWSADLFRYPDVQNTLPYRGFFVCAVTTTIDSLLKSAGCGVKIGWCMPLTASLAALVKRLHNLTTPKRQNGLYADELTRSAHLAPLLQMRVEQEAKSLFVSLPL